MSASDVNSAIFTTDSKKEVEKKMNSAFTGGRETIEKQQKEGGNPDICNIYKYNHFLFEEDDERIEEMRHLCKKGQIRCKDCKKQLVQKINNFLQEHQKKRQLAKAKLSEFILTD